MGARGRVPGGGGGAETGALHYLLFTDDPRRGITLCMRIRSLSLFPCVYMYMRCILVCIYIYSRVYMPIRHTAQHADSKAHAQNRSTDQWSRSRLLLAEEQQRQQQRCGGGRLVAHLSMLSPRLLLYSLSRTLPARVAAHKTKREKGEALLSPARSLADWRAQPREICCDARVVVVVVRPRRSGRNCRGWRASLWH